MNNPFTPNFGQVPACLAGRDFMIDEVVRAFENGLGDPSLSSVFIGARGTGKTALLTYLGKEAQQRGWIVVNTMCMPGLLEDIYLQTAQAASEYIDSGSKRRFTSVTFGGLVGAEWENEEGPQPNWRLAMSAILDDLAEKDLGLLITIDEVDPKLTELIVFATVYQLFMRENRKVGFLMAGLPSKISSLVNNPSASFLRRASQFRLERIGDHDIEKAFRQTIQSAGKSIEEPALQMAVAAIEGFPYMMQLVGFRSWIEAGQHTEVTSAHVEEGVRMAVLDMENRVLRSTLSEMSAVDLAFLEAMLPDEACSATAEIGKRMGKPESYVARYRARLIESGAIEPAGHGYVSFALPQLRGYLPKYLQS